MDRRYRSLCEGSRKTLDSRPRGTRAVELRAGKLQDGLRHSLEDGFDGTALQQLAGLSQTMPMGLKPINQNEAVAFLSARACKNPVVSVLHEAFPEFGNRRKKSLVYSGGPYSDMPVTTLSVAPPIRSA